MPIINDKFYNKTELLKKCGTIKQIAGYKRYVYAEGKAKGVEAVDINNGNGLLFTVLLDRNMDIASASYRGVNLSYITKNQIVAPWYYDKDDDEWFRSFIGGLLTTCGISHAGAPCIDNGKYLGLHGRISNSPVDNISCRSFWEDEDYIIELSGSSYETKFFGENLVLHRNIRVVAGENKIILEDVIENQGFERSPIMMIYHFNLGFPIVNDGSKIDINSCNSYPTTEESKKRIDEQFIVTKPEHGIIENVYFHEFFKDDKMGKATIINKEGLGIYIEFDLKELPYLNLWKMLGEGEYVVGLEPSNCMTLGRDKERKRGKLTYIEPGEKKVFKIEIGIL